MTDSVTLTLPRSHVEKIRRDNRPLPGCESEEGRCQICEQLAAIREECDRALGGPPPDVDDPHPTEDAIPSAGYR